MKSIGNVIKEARIKKKLSRGKLEKLTKIKKEFIESLEDERWEELPEYPVVTGFVKSIASQLKSDEKHLVALLRRDYPPKVLSINPKPEISEKFKWSPRLTFLVGIVSVTLFIIGYLTFQYISFIQPPKLEVQEPQEGQVVTSETVVVEGSTDPDSVVLVNNQPTVVSEDGSFSAEIDIFQGTEEVVVISRSRSGKETRVVRKIDVSLE